MKRKNSRGRVRIISIRKRLILIALLVVLGILLFKGREILKAQKLEYASKETLVEDLKSEIESEINKEKAKENIDEDAITDEEYESLAREELGLIKKDEIVIKPR